MISGLKIKIIKIMKKFACALIAALALFEAYPKVSFFADPAQYGITPIDSDDPFYVNPVAITGLSEKPLTQLLGIDVEHCTSLNVEYASNMVSDGMRTSNNTFALSLLDRGELFGGDGYTELDAYLPTDSQFARMYRFLGGWKYNLTKDLHVDLGGTLIYASKRISGAGITGAGTHFTGDIYAGLIFESLLNPFAYYCYNFDYDSNKITIGVNPKFDLSNITNIENLSLEIEAYCGYVKANRWTADDRIDGALPHNNYFYVQTEAQLVYVLANRWRFTIGGGYAHNDGARDIKNLSNSPNNLLWINTSIGFIF